MLIIKNGLLILGIFLVLLACLLFLLLFIVGVSIKYDSNKGGKIYITLFKIPFVLSFSKIESYIQKSFNKDRFSKKQKKSKKGTGIGIKIIKNFLIRIKFRKFIFRIKYSLEDPMKTAIINGFLWSIVSIIYSIFIKNINYKKLQILISPQFTESNFDFYFECVLFIKLVN